MLFRPRRQARYRYMTNVGFLNYEARILSVVSFKVPYMHPMMKHRRRELLGALRGGLTREDFDEMTRHWYIKQGWMKRRRDKRGIMRVLPDPWAMFREWEDKYKDKHPEWESPWVPRQQQRRHSLAKIEATTAKYPTGRAYRRKGESAKRRSSYGGGNYD